MKQPIDDLFRDKLLSLERTPSESAWARIQGANARKAFPWLKVAASVLVVAVSTAILVSAIRDTNTDPVTSIAESKSNTNVTVEESKEPLATESTPVAVNKTTPVVNQVSESRSLNKSPDTDVKSDPVLVESLPVASFETKNESVEEPLVSDASVIQPEVVVAESDKEVETDERLTFTIDAETINQKYLKKSYAQATEETKKSSGIRKLLEKADDLKNDNPFGDLRQMKNEVLALNFPSARKTEQNK